VKRGETGNRRGYVGVPVQADFKRRERRIVAAIFAIATSVLFIGSFGFALFEISFATAGPPDPSVPDGDPCCAYPDTVGEIASASMAGVGALLVSGALAIFGISAGSLAYSGVQLVKRRLKIATGVLFLGLALILAATIPV
jgi:nitrate reductase NapE component